MKTYFKPVILMSDGGDGELFPPGHEGSVGGGDGGEWGTGGDSNRSAFVQQTVDLSAQTTGAENLEKSYVASETTPPIEEFLGGQ